MEVNFQVPAGWAAHTNPETSQSPASSNNFIFTVLVWGESNKRFTQVSGTVRHPPGLFNQSSNQSVSQSVNVNVPVVGGIASIENIT